MTKSTLSFRAKEQPYKLARRAYLTLLQLHAVDIELEHRFHAMDRSICPEVYDEHAPEYDFGCVGTSTEQNLLLTVADAFGCDPCLLDDVLIEVVHFQEARWIGAFRF